MQSVGGLRLLDGFFVGDQHTARDQQFILLNQITLVINLTNSQIRNYYEHYDIRYLNLNWKDFSQKPNFAENICKAINENFELFESVLVHGLNHLDEPITLCAIFMMHKFRWSLYKTLEYLQAKVNGLTFTSTSFSLLKLQELRLLTTQVKLSYNWEVKPENQRELILRNTFLNSSQRKQNDGFNKKTEIVCKKNKNTRRVSWIMKEKPSAIQPESSRVQRLKNQENRMKEHIILSVRKIIAQSTNKQNKTTENYNKQLNRKSEKLIAKKLSSNEPSLSMKKYKSFYSLASLSSFEKLQNPSTELTQKNQPIKCQNMTKFPNQSYDRIKTEKSEKMNEKIFNCGIDKGCLAKTQTKDGNKSTIEIHLTRTHSEQLTIKGSVGKSKQKQMSIVSSKISLRKASPHKKFQMGFGK